MAISETDVLINGKVDWKGRPATKNKHGGMHAAMFVLGGFFGFILLNSKYYLEKQRKFFSLGINAVENLEYWYSNCFVFISPLTDLGNILKRCGRVI
ncbi:hypothetical protein HanPI659440_Chr04g0167991 [Helianthus annuus]|nr:hypothetical protein HanPI659440_Chr04g0167991 [Helianthus annuus]